MEIDLLQQYNKKIIDWDSAERVLWYPNRMLHPGDMEHINKQDALEIYKKDRGTWFIRDEERALVEQVNKEWEERDKNTDAYSLTLIVEDPSNGHSYRIHGQIEPGQGYIILTQPTVSDYIVLQDMDWSKVEGTIINDDGTRSVASMTIDSNGNLTVSNSPSITATTVSNPLSATVSSRRPSDVTISVDGVRIGEAQSINASTIMSNGSRADSHRIRQGVTGTLQLDTTQFTREVLDQLTGVLTGETPLPRLPDEVVSLPVEMEDR
jgi:hypothetical protein